MAEIVKAYRTILRHVKKLPSSAIASPISQAPAPLDDIVSQFRAHRVETDSKKIASMRQVALNYATLISSITELTSLRALDFGEKLDPRDKIRLTASRVGLSVPKFSDEPRSEG